MGNRHLILDLDGADFCVKCAPRVACETNRKIWREMDIREAAISEEGRIVRYILNGVVRDCIFLSIPYDMTPDGVRVAGRRINTQS